MPLDPATAAKLVKLLGMLGSNHDGEVAAAGRAVHKLVQTRGLHWLDVITPEPETLVQWREPGQGDWLDAVMVCVFTRGAPLTAWDKKFLISISQRDNLSEKQQKQLNRILDNCRLHACCTV
jgi:hypothetical protein